jgi:5-methylcytosine-specific restriction protein A
MTDIETLRPQLPLHVIDLVRDAGIDVSDWANFKGGAAKANRNPRYCYRWAFADPERIVLNLWFDSLANKSGSISVTDNLRRTAKSRATKGVWKGRARDFDEAVRFAYENALPVRAIVNLGKRRIGNSRSTKASRVKVRLLDSVTWAVTEYNYASGIFTVTRGATPAPVVDQFDVDPLGEALPERRSITGQVYHRDPEVRARVLARAAGRCEFCGSLGFRTTGGSIFLETHHVIPLSENGADAVSNVAALCANHHREAHHGASASTIRAALLKRIARRKEPPLKRHRAAKSKAAHAGTAR